MTNIVNASLYQHQRYVSLDGHVFSWHAYLMSDAFYSALDGGEQRAVNQCVEIAKTIHRGMTAAQDATATRSRCMAGCSRGAGTIWSMTGWPKKAAMCSSRRARPTR